MKKGRRIGKAARNIFLRSTRNRQSKPGRDRGKSQGTPARGTFLCTTRKHSFKDLAVSRDFRGTRVNLVATNFSGLTAEIRRGKKEPRGKNVGAEVARTRVYAAAVVG